MGMCLPQSYTSCSFITFFIMSLDLMIGALRKGQNGNEILAILDALAGGDSDSISTESAGAQPTLEPIEF